MHWAYPIKRGCNFAGAALSGGHERLARGGDADLPRANAPADLGALAARGSRLVAGSGLTSR